MSEHGYEDYGYDDPSAADFASGGYDEYDPQEIANAAAQRVVGAMAPIIQQQQDAAQSVDRERRLPAVALPAPGGRLDERPDASAARRPETRRRHGSWNQQPRTDHRRRTEDRPVLWTPKTG